MAGSWAIPAWVAAPARGAVSARVRAPCSISVLTREREIPPIASASRRSMRWPACSGEGVTWIGPEDSGEEGGEDSGEDGGEEGGGSAMVSGINLGAPGGKDERWATE